MRVLSFLIGCCKVALLLVEGLLLIVGRLVLLELPPTRAKAELAVDAWGRLDMLPLRPLLGKVWLIEPVELPCLTLAT